MANTPKVDALAQAASGGVYATPETAAMLCNLEDDGLVSRAADRRGVYVRVITPAGRRALRGQLMACERIMAKHRAAMVAIQAGNRAETCPLSKRAASDLARQIADLKTATA